MCVYIGVVFIVDFVKIVRVDFAGVVYVEIAGGAIRCVDLCVVCVSGEGAVRAWWMIFGVVLGVFNVTTSVPSST